MDNGKSVIVIGSSGVLGALICGQVQKLFNNGLKLIVTDYNARRGMEFAKSLGKNTQYRYLDINEKKSIESAIEGTDICIVALSQQEPVIQQICIEMGITSVDVVSSFDFVKKAKALDKKAIESNTSVVLMAGFFPGLSGVIANDLINTNPTLNRMDIGYLANKNGQMGLSGLKDVIKIMSQPVMYRKNGKYKLYPAFKVKKKLPYADPFGEKLSFLVNWSGEEHILKELYPNIDFNYWITTDKKIFTYLFKIIRFLISLKLFNSDKKKGKLAKFIFKNIKRDENLPETTSFSFCGTDSLNSGVCVRRSILVDSDYETTALFAAAIAKKVNSGRFKGVLFPFQVTNYNEISNIMGINNNK